MYDVYDDYFAVAYQLLRRGQGGLFATSRTAKLAIYEFQYESSGRELAPVLGRSKEQMAVFQGIIFGTIPEDRIRDRDLYEISHLMELYAYVKHGGFAPLSEKDLLLFSQQLGIKQEDLRQYMKSMDSDVSVSRGCRSR